MEAAARRARELGYRVVMVASSVEEPVDQALDRLLELRNRSRERDGAPLCIVAGGEARVPTGKRRGLGGRAQELAAAAAVRLDGVPGCLFLAAGSDGVDGNSPAAGAMADGQTLSRSRRAGLGIEASRRNGNTYRLFSARGDSVVTGWTGTNLRDLYLFLESPGTARSVREASGDRRGWSSGERR